MDNVSAISASDEFNYAEAPQIDISTLPFPVLILSTKDGQVLRVNNLLSEMLNSEKENLIGNSMPGLFDKEVDRNNIVKQLQKNLIISSQAITLQNKENKKIKKNAALSLPIINGEECILVAVQAGLQNELLIKKLRTAIQRYSIALQAADVGIWSWSLMSDRIAWDDTMYGLYGKKIGSFSGTQDEVINFIVPEDREEQIEIYKKIYEEGGKFDTKFRIMRPDGETRVIINRGEAIVNDNGIVVSMVGTCWDATENFALHAKIEHQSLHDPLTGLLNRSEMQRRLGELLQQMMQEPTDNTYCYFDLDRFKVVNDTYGHDAGDALLKSVTEYLKPFIKKSDPFARIGGDEFAIIITNSSTTDARKVAERLLQAAKEFHFEWSGKVFDISLSMALVSITQEKSVNDILGEADVALSAAKDSGRNRIHEYRPHDSTMIRRHDEMNWLVELEDALRGERFQLNFQPIQPIANDIEDGLHYEVLLRVIDIKGEVISPYELLKAAEQFDMATRVDRWVINAVFDWLKANPEHCEELSICSINLSGASISDQAFLEYLKDKLHDQDIPHEKICFEITENAAIKNIKKAGVFIKRIKEFGCNFALDDFGSGLSSFAYLKDLPVDFLKIDGVFVKSINTVQVDYAMVKAINDVGQIMEMKTIAEYVENEEVFEKLKEIGVDYGQGYYFGKSAKLEQVIVVDSVVAESD